MKKAISLLIALVMLFSLTACGAANKPDPELQTVKTDMLTQLSVNNATDIPTDKLMNLYGIAADKVADNASFMILSDVFPAEIIMIKAVDATAAEEIAALLNTRLESLKAQSVNYDAESYAIAQACTVEIKRDVYVSMFFSEYGTQMTEIYNSYF